MIKEKTKDSIRDNFFNNIIVNDWNALPFEVVEAPTVNSFKAKIDKIFEKNNTYRTAKRLDRL